MSQLAVHESSNFEETSDDDELDDLGQGELNTFAKEMIRSKSKKNKRFINMYRIRNAHKRNVPIGFTGFDFKPDPDMMPPSTPQHKAFKNIFGDTKKGQSERAMISASKIDEVQPFRQQKSVNVNNSLNFSDNSRNILIPNHGPAIQVANSHKLDTVGPDDIILDDINPQRRQPQPPKT